MIDSKRAVSDVIVAVLLIVISITAVALISVFVIPLVRNLTVDIEPGTFTIESACYDPVNYSLSIYVSRKTGNGDINFSAIELVWYGGEGSSWKNTGIPEEGARRGYIIPFVDKIPIQIDVFPWVFKGRERRGSVTSSFKDIKVSESCLRSDRENAAFVGAQASLGLSAPGTPPSPTGLD